jgi:regulator of RNase E activity RraA
MRSRGDAATRLDPAAQVAILVGSKRACGGPIITESPLPAGPGDGELLARARAGLTVALVSDALDGLGYMRQALPPSIRGLDDGLFAVGRARTGLYREVYRTVPGANPYALEIALVDDLRPDQIVVLACGGSRRIAPWGELLTTASIARGAVGCLTDGMVRDTRAIRALGFPVFHGGIGPLDSKGRGEVAEIDVPVEIAGVPVRPGDLVFGDADGVVVVPRAVEAQALAARLASLSEQVGLADFARVARDLGACLDAGDRVATAAVARRLLRLSEDSLFSVMLYADQSAL